MSSLVLELQREAMDPHARLSDILRKAVVVATKLEIEELKSWAERELKGYGNSEIPSYRKVQGELKAHNPYHGYIPVVIQDTKIAKMLSHRDIGQPVSELEALCFQDKKESSLQVPLPHEWLMKIFGNSEEFHLGMVPTLVVGRAQLLGILDGVRNEVLNWSLELEKQGILGEGMTFSKEEINKASSTTYNIKTFKGVLGNVNASNIQFGDYSSIHSELKDKGVPQNERNELENILDDLRTAEPQKHKGLVTRGFDWLSRNGSTIGALSDTIRGWFESLS